MKLELKLKLAVVMALVGTAVPAFAAYQTYADGSFTEFTEADGYRRWVHQLPVGGGQFRVQYDIKEQYYSVNGSAFLGESYRADDSNLDGVTDSVSTTFKMPNGAAILIKSESRDGGGVWFHQYADTSARRFSSAYTPGRADLDGRNTVRVYSNGFCYVQGDGSCEMETACDLQIQSVNQLSQFNVVEAARRNRDADLLSRRLAEMRYERERMILSACKAGR